MTTIYTKKELPKRKEFDFYETPKELVRASLGLLDLPKNYKLQVLDPGAGNGVWGHELIKVCNQALITGIEIQKDLNKPRDYLFWNKVDFLDWKVPHKFDLIMGNPPYILSEEFVRKSIRMLDKYGTLIFLLRLEFMASQKRGKGLYKEFPPKKVYICSRRPSFSGDRKTDSDEYAIYIWRAGYKGKTQLDWLDWNYE